jgi:hypothetical protein
MVTLRNYLDGMHERLQIYKMRLLTHKQNPCADPTDIKFYKELIEMYEVEIGGYELVLQAYEIIDPPKPWILETDCWQSVQEIMTKEVVIAMRMKWSWRNLKWLYYVEYHLSR